MIKPSILCLCVFGLYVKANTEENNSQNAINTVNVDSNLTTASNLLVPDQINGTDKDFNKTVTEIQTENTPEINQTSSLDTNNRTAILSAEKLQNEPNKINDNKIGNESFVDKVEQVVRRLFKRDIVGSLVDRNTDELTDNNPKITVPMFAQAEYYALRQRKEEIEENKLKWAGKENLTQYHDLIQETWEKLVNWSQDHLKFEDKIIMINKLKQHDHIHSKYRFASILFIFK